jgi:intein-encoded DNA endonuclease-like protein
MVKVTQEIADRIILEYTQNRKSTCDISKMLSISDTTIIRHLRLRGVPVDLTVRKRLLPLKCDYFKEIDTEEKSYFLGLLYADGNVCFDRYKHHYQMSLSLCDQDIVDKFSLTLYGHIRTREYQPREKNAQKQYYISASSKEFCSDLIRHGCVPKKSLILMPPNITEEFIRPFIRGYHDGDGCFIHSPNRGKTNYNFMWSAISTDQFCGWVKNCIEDLIQVRSSLYLVQKKYTVVQVASRPDLMRLGEWLYRDKGDCYINRKYQQWMDVKHKLVQPYRALWTEEDENLLIKLLPYKSIEELSYILNKTPSSIETKVNRLGLNRLKGKRKYWTQQEIDKLIEHMGNSTLSELARMLHKPLGSIKSKIRQLRQ